MVAKVLSSIQFAADGSNLAAVETFCGTGNWQPDHTYPAVGTATSPIQVLTRSSGWVPVKDWDGLFVVPAAIYSTYFV
jgi:hypothetical protein